MVANISSEGRLKARYLPGALSQGVLMITLRGEYYCHSRFQMKLRLGEVVTFAG